MRSNHVCTEITAMTNFGMFSHLRTVITSLADIFGGQSAVRWAGGARLFVKRGVFKQDLTGKQFGTDLDRSFQRGVRLTRVFTTQEP